MSSAVWRALRGAISGAIATVPMTVVMEGLRRNLPIHEQYPLPPRLIIASLSAQTGTRPYLTNEQEHDLAWVAHYLFGASMGAAYGLMTPRMASHRVLRGALFGSCVWAISYQGWLPALNILPPSSWSPRRRVALMIAAHLVWGVTLAELHAALSRQAGDDPQRSVQAEANGSLDPREQAVSGLSADPQKEVTVVR
jgi:uncharacterized membrane protein YagU involved in acid resistance